MVRLERGALRRVGPPVGGVLDRAYHGGALAPVGEAPLPSQLGAARRGVKLVAIGDGAPRADAHLLRARPRLRVGRWGRGKVGRWGRGKVGGGRGLGGEVRGLVGQLDGPVPTAVTLSSA